MPATFYFIIKSFLFLVQIWLDLRIIHTGFKTERFLNRVFWALKIRARKKYFVLEFCIFHAWRSFDTENTRFKHEILDFFLSVGGAFQSRFAACVSPFPFCPYSWVRGIW